MSRARSGLLWLMLASPLPIQAQAGPPSCATAEHRQFDFWVGRWEVTAPGGQQAGTNEVTLEEGGCLIHEHWAGARGGTGQSFNFYSATEGRWHQVWVDNGGTYLHLTGTFTDGRMVLTGDAPGSGGEPTPQRLSFVPNPDGTVRQLWESSPDGGRTWQVVFDGLYRKPQP